MIKYLIIIGVLLALIYYAVDLYVYRQVFCLVQRASALERAGNVEDRDLIRSQVDALVGRSAVSSLISIIHDKTLNSLDRLMAQHILLGYKNNFGRLRNEDSATASYRAAMALHVAPDYHSLDYAKCVEMIDGDDDLSRLAAVKRLGELGKADGLRYVQRRLKDPYWKIRRAAVNAMVSIGGKNIGGRILALSSDRVAAVADTAIIAAGKLIRGRKERKKIQSLLSDHFHAASEALAYSGDIEAIPILEKFLSAPLRENRIDAAKAMMKLGSEKGFDFLVEHLKVGDDETRALAARALVFDRTRDVTDYLIEASTDCAGVVRCAAVDALGFLEGEKVSAALRAALLDRLPTVRAASIRAIGRQKDVRLLEFIGDALRDSDPIVRVAALEAAVDLDYVEVRKYVEVLLNDRDEKVRAAAFRADRALSSHED